MIEVVVRNRQRARAVNLRLVSQVARALLNELPGLESCELGVLLVSAQQMARLNERFLGHWGSTDVITFDYSDRASRVVPRASHLCGEVFICLDQAVREARRFRTTWQSELVRYLVHGVLHLRGFSDLTPVFRRVMKREENRLLRRLSRGLPLGRLARPKARLRGSQNSCSNAAHETTVRP